jgi:hypothetical protein
MPFSPEVCRHIFTAFTSGDSTDFIYTDYLNIFELIGVLILMAHNSYRKKLQCKHLPNLVMFVLFDFTHQGRLINREMILIFESVLNGFCRVTGQERPKYEYLNKYVMERFIRANTLEALEKVVVYRRMIEEVEGNNDCFQLFKRFDQDIYGLFTQESYLFRVGQYRRYDKDEVEYFYRVLRKVNLDRNYIDVELV